MEGPILQPARAEGQTYQQQKGPILQPARVEGHTYQQQKVAPLAERQPQKVEPQQGIIKNY